MDIILSPAAADTAASTDRIASEPSRPRSICWRFVVQEHSATHRHWDFRLEMGGILASWVVALGPSLDPQRRRLAVEAEDQPIDYLSFAGPIQHGAHSTCGGGELRIWDQGSYQLVGGSDPEKARHLGLLHLQLQGTILHGGFALRRMGEGSTGRNWLLMKEDDAAAKAGWSIA